MKLHRILQRIKTLVITSSLLLYISFAPLAVSAEELITPSEAESTTSSEEVVQAEPEPTVVPEPTPVVSEPPQAPTPVNTTGPTSPTGESRSTYIYNESTGLWENDHYTWDPVSKQTLPKTTTNYAFNTTTGMWETTEWQYDAAAEKFIPRVIAISVIAPAEADSSQNAGATIQVGNHTTARTQLDSCSTSGDASVLKNTNGGDANSGSAYTMANVLNMLGSSWGNLGSNVNTFTTDIEGDVTGDLYVNPNSSAEASSNATSSLNVNATNTGSISNNIYLCAKSGKATVNSNTTGGDATSGSADAVINLMNLINSSILAGHSFVGVMNINGNFNGDILLPDYLRIDNLISPNNEVSATLGDTEIENSEVLASVLSNTDINNDITTTAKSGEATIDKNNFAGDASTGSAQTNITLLNLTGRDIVGNNGLLVFVNVLGTWVGFIVDKPSGSTTAALGGGIISNTKKTSVTLAASEDYGIKNNVKVAAASGDAEVSENTTAGSAKTGDVSASANVLNLVNTKLSLKDWFGVLFINVFGSWHGSFGVDTANGNIAALQNVAETGSVPVQDAQVFKFVPTGQKKAKLQNVTSVYDQTGVPDRYPEAILADANVTDMPIQPFKSTTGSTKQTKSSNMLVGVLNFGGIATLSYLGLDQLSQISRKKRTSRVVNQK